MRTKSSRETSRSSVTGEADSHIGDDPQISAQIVRRLPPHVAALLLELTELLERALEILDVARGLLLLQGKILAARFPRCWCCTAPSRLAVRGTLRPGRTLMRLRIAIQFQDHAFVELAQFAGDFPQIVALLPALQARAPRRRSGRRLRSVGSSPLRRGAGSVQRRSARPGCGRTIRLAAATRPR